MDALKEEKVVLIKNPEDAKNLLLGSDNSTQSKKNNRLSLFSKTSLSAAKKPSRSSLSFGSKTQREFHEEPAIQKLARKCEKLVTTENLALQQLNTLFFLNWLKDIDAKTENFISKTFGIELAEGKDSQTLCVIKISRINAQLPENEPYISCIFQCELDAPGAGLSLAHACEALAKPSPTETEKTRKKLFFLRSLMQEETDKDSSYEKSLANFISTYFGVKNTQNPREMCTHLSDTLKKTLTEKEVDQFELDAAKALTGKEWLIHYGSIAINLTKPLFNQVSEHIYLGKHPSERQATKIMKKFDSTKKNLIFSLVSHDEDKTSSVLYKKSSMPFWDKNNIDYIKVVLKDFGKPFRPTLDHPNKDYTNEELDKLYTEIYQKLLRAIAIVKADGAALFHCKAGKGRSVWALAVFYMLCPEELPGTNGDVEKIWDRMIAVRPHIDKGPDDKRAALDCVHYIKTVLQQNIQTVPVGDHDNNAEPRRDDQPHDERKSSFERMMNTL